MTVRYHGRLLAELGALLGVCLAAAGCQTSAVRSDAAPAIASNNDPQHSNTLLSYLRGDRRDQPGLPSGQVVSILRPMALDGDGPAGPPLSGWDPIQRTAGEQSEAPAAAPTPTIAASPAATNADAQAPPPGAAPTPVIAASTAATNAAAQTLPQPQLEPPSQLNPPTPIAEQPALVEHAPVILPGGPAHPPREFDKRSYPLYIVEPPDILLIQSAKGLLDQPVKLQTPVSMDGTINLGSYGLVYVAGMTIDAVREAVTAQLAKRVKDLDVRSVSVEVIAYNSKVYYIISDGGGYGEQVTRFPATGNETVLDALAQVGGLPVVASKRHIWLARATPGDAAHPQILPVDWVGITQRGSAATNYQIFPGDRVYVSSDPWVRGDTWIARRLAPVQNILGTVLLGSTAVNSIRGINTGGIP